MFSGNNAGNVETDIKPYILDAIRAVFKNSGIDVGDINSLMRDIESKCANNDQNVVNKEPMGSRRLLNNILTEAITNTLTKSFHLDEEGLVTIQKALNQLFSPTTSKGIWDFSRWVFGAKSETDSLVVIGIMAFKIFMDLMVTYKNKENPNESLLAAIGAINIDTVRADVVKLAGITAAAVAGYYIRDRIMNVINNAIVSMTNTVSQFFARVFGWLEKCFAGSNQATVHSTGVMTEQLQNDEMPRQGASNSAEASSSNSPVNLGDVVGQTLFGSSSQPSMVHDADMSLANGSVDMSATRPSR